MTAYFDAMLRYFEFSGRSSRAQYWLYWLICTLICLLAVGADYVLLGIYPTAEHPGPLAAFAAIIHIFPGLSVTVRRLHDIGRSGWWYWLQLIPIIGAIIHLVMMCTRGDEWDNDFGSAPDSDRPLAAATPRMVRSTIPRQVRMGNSTPRPAHTGGGGDVQRFI